MPRSRFVPASRLLPLIVYFAVAVVALLLGDLAVRALAPDAGGRGLLAAAWLVLFPAGAVLVWRRGRRGPGGGN